MRNRRNIKAGKGSVSGTRTVPAFDQQPGWYLAGCGRSSGRPGLLVNIGQKEAMERIFKDRQQAGEILGRWLRPKYGELNPLVLGIPRGGVEVAYYVAQELQADLSVIVTKKLPMPGHIEFAFGAIAEDGPVYVNPEAEQVLSAEMIEQVISQQREEVRRRVQVYRQGKPLPDLQGRTVLLVDDGIATGATLVPALLLCRQRERGAGDHRRTGFGHSL
jgi:predicted phosphoribosyltransferase